MTPDRLVTWVLPAYDEAASIGDLIDRIAAVSEGEGWTYRVLVVDDGSADDTGALAAAKAPGVPVEVLRNEPNQGLGRTLRRGLRAALEHASPDDVIVTLDADLTQDPAFVPGMLERLDEGADVVIASRYRPGSAVEGLSAVRSALSFAASRAVTMVRPVPGVRDYSCGFRAYRARVLAEGFARDGDGFVSEPGFACMVEIAQRLRGHAVFAEVPFVLHYADRRKASTMRVLPTIGAYFRVIAGIVLAERSRVPAPVLAVAATGISVGAVAQLMLRTGAASLPVDSLGGTLAQAMGSPPVLAGLALYVVSSLLWLGVISRVDVSVAYPLGAFGYVLVVVLARLSGEPVPPLRWAGVVAIVAGIVLVGWFGARPAERTRP